MSFKVSGKYLGGPMTFETHSKESAIRIIKKLGDLFQLDNELSDDNNIRFTEELIGMLK